MSPTNKKLANKLDKFTSFSVSSALVPSVSKDGIILGPYTIKQVDGLFVIERKKRVLYRVYSKSTALIIAGMLHKNYSVSDIKNMVDIDRQLISVKNDLEVFKHHHAIAIRNNDSIKEGIMLARFENANEKYQDIKQTIQKSYLRLF